MKHVRDTEIFKQLVRDLSVNVHELAALLREADSAVSIDWQGATAEELANTIEDLYDCADGLLVNASNLRSVFTSLMLLTLTGDELESEHAQNLDAVEGPPGVG